MGVLACGRAGCRRVMCDLRVEGRYVCNDCAKEFRELMGSKKRPLEKLVRKFEKFMATRRGQESVEDNSEGITVDEFLYPPQFN